MATTLLHFLGCLLGTMINQPVVNIYLSPQEGTEVDSQGIYASVVDLVECQDDWSKIRTADGLEGWVLSSQITENSSYEKSEKRRPVQNLFAHIYRIPSVIAFPPLLTIPYGSLVKLEDPLDASERWIAVELVNGEKGWIQRGDLDFSPQEKTLEEILHLSKKFLGLPYTWGGTSSYGFDCSGFVQMLFREMGVQLPRNSYQQAISDLFLPVPLDNLQPGDLLFFGVTRVTHVGLYLGGGEFIHAGVTELPMIMISNIGNDKYNILSATRLRYRNSR